MTPEEFRKAGHELIDWIADYRRDLHNGPVKSRVAPGEVRSQFAATPPTDVVPFESLLNDLDRAVVPGVTQMQHPMNFGWFPSNAALSSVLGDMASSGLGTLGISWESCPALTEVEEVVCDWMRQLVGLSDAWRGSIQDTASTACLTALIAARERARKKPDVAGGTSAGGLRYAVYTTEQAHSSVRKAAILAGVFEDNVRLVPTDPATYGMSAAALADLLDADVRAGLSPIAVVATVGTTAVTAMDPVADIAVVAQRNGLWLHVDAAMAGTAMLLPDQRYLWHGVEDADSISWNPHKWLGTILDCSLFYLRDVDELTGIMSTAPVYLRSASDGQVTQFRDWGIPLGRRFRALKLWFHLSLDGVPAMRARIQRDLDNARWFAGLIESAPDWELVLPVWLQTVVVRHNPAGLSGAALDKHTQDWIARINDSGVAFLSGAVLDGRWVARVSVGVEGTEREHLQRLWDTMQEAVQDAARGQ